MQAVIGAAALCVFIGAAPASGRMMLVPLSAQPLADAAIAADARLVGRGWLPGALIVEGERDAIARRIGDGAVIVAAIGGCVQ
ncbi:hypothetical protein [Sphingomonas sp. ID0503]|uniref:hypothetical protein n=1 Tax=Sphingomonas sp. ID0503 TaxID=3399691 RepID=UPI003AFB0E4E